MNTSTRSFVLIGPMIAAAVVLAGCGSTSTPAASASASPGSTAASPAAGGPSVSSSASSPAGGGMPMPTAPAGPHNQADITFAQDMTVHHQGAIAMADLAATRASDPKVKDLAAQIKAAQGPEITEMSGWLAAWAPSTDMNGMPNTTAATSGMPGMSGMGSDSAMPGMMSDQQMTQLGAASGAAFDKLFLQLMIEHHQGALTMSQTETTGGSNPSARNLASSIIASQTAQITQMQDLLKGK